MQKVENLYPYIHLFLLVLIRGKQKGRSGMRRTLTQMIHSWFNWSTKGTFTDNTYHRMARNGFALLIGSLLSTTKLTVTDIFLRWQWLPSTLRLELRCCQWIERINATRSFIPLFPRVLIKKKRIVECREICKI